MDACAGVPGCALGEQFLEPLHRRGIAAHRPHVALGDHAVPVLARGGLQPDGAASGEQALVCARRSNQAARHREHAGAVMPQPVLQGFFFDPPVTGGAVQFEDLALGHAGALFDPLVEFGERDFEPRGEPPAQGALAGAAQPQQRDPQPRRSLDRKIAELAQGHCQGAGEGRELADRRIGARRFDLDQEAPAQSGSCGGFFERQSQPGPAFADAGREGLEKSGGRTGASHAGQYIAFAGVVKSPMMP